MSALSKGEEDPPGDLLTLSELEGALNILRMKSAPVPDRVTNQALRNTRTFAAGDIPGPWKIT